MPNPTLPITLIKGAFKVVLVSTRGPVTWGHNKYPVTEKGVGGLASATGPLIEELGFDWMCADDVRSHEPFFIKHQGRRLKVRLVAPPTINLGRDLKPHEISALQRAGIKNEKMPSTGVLLPEHVIALHREFVNGTLWPHHHGPIVWNAVRDGPSLWRTPEEVKYPNGRPFDESDFFCFQYGYLPMNQAFANQIVGMKESQPEIPLLALMQDMHLYPVGRLVKEQDPSIICSNFTHGRFPYEPYDFRFPPEIIDMTIGALGHYDLIGVQRPEDARQVLGFFSSLPEMFIVGNPRGGETKIGNRTTGRVTTVGVYPVAPDIERLRRVRDANPDIWWQDKRKRARDEREFLVVGVSDRSDIIKALLERILAVPRAFELDPSLIGKLRLSQVVVKNRMDVEAHRQLITKLEEAQQSINSRFGYPAIDLLIADGSNLPELIARSMEADVIVAPTAEGMGMGVQESHALNYEAGGRAVTILAEETGFRSLTGDYALVVNFGDVEQLAQAYVRAYYMPPEEREWRSRNIYKIITSRGYEHHIYPQLKALEQVLALQPPSPIRGRTQPEHNI